MTWIDEALAASRERWLKLSACCLALFCAMTSTAQNGVNAWVGQLCARRYGSAMSPRSFRNIRTVGQFGLEVRRLRKAAELTQAELAAQAGVSRRWLGRLERGHTGAELDNIMRLARALGLSLRFEESPPP